MHLKNHIRSFLDRLRRAYLRFQPRTDASQFYSSDAARKRVLVIGVYLSDRKNTAAQTAREFSASKYFDVTQHWAVIGSSSTDPVLAAVTSEISVGKVPRSIMLNCLLAKAEIDAFEYLVVCDDDIVMQRGFLDLYLGLQAAYDLSLAQPARTKNSWIDHPITGQVKGSDCRLTRFVEIGPMFSMHRSLFKRLLPLDTAIPMGWGLDFAWPLMVESEKKRMGIIDATPVDHSLRQPKTGYGSKEVHDAMQRFLAKTPHLSEKECQVTLVEHRTGAHKNIS